MTQVRTSPSKIYQKVISEIGCDKKNKAMQELQPWTAVSTCSDLVGWSDLLPRSYVYTTWTADIFVCCPLHLRVTLSMLQIDEKLVQNPIATGQDLAISHRFIINFGAYKKMFVMLIKLSFAGFRYKC